MKRINYNLVVFVFILLCTAFLLRSTGVSAAPALTNITNELVDPSQVDNYDSNGASIGSVGYMVVGKGNYSQSQTGFTIESPNQQIKVKLENANYCTTRAPGNYTAVDSPSPSASAVTTFYTVSGGILDTYTAVKSCAAPDYTTAVLNLQLVRPGVYGALIGVSYDDPGATSSQNAFRAIALDASGAPLLTAKVGLDKDIANANLPFLLQPVPVPPALSTFSWSITNTNTPRDTISNYNIPFSVRCDTTSASP